MKTYYLCNLATKQVLSGGELPETFGNINGLGGLTPAHLADLTQFGSTDFGFLSYSAAVVAGMDMNTLAAVHYAVTRQAWFPIEMERDVRKSGGFHTGNYWFHSDEMSRAHYATFLSLAIEKNLPTEYVVHNAWKTMSGEYVSMSIGLLRDIRDVGIVLESALFSCAENHRQAMISSVDSLSYDFSGNWPVRFAG